MKRWRDFTILVIIMICCSEANGQYFGRNKTRYNSFDFKVLETPHFHVYHYMEDTIVKYLGTISERWYTLHQETFHDTIHFKNPIILYKNHADFQQTSAIRSLIGIGTGGVTEALKNRIVMPVMETWAQTDHVIGHEMVHAFQYNMLKDNDSLSLENVQNIPLWMVEGLAEYLSIGPVDANTAMWMRDAVIQEDIPTLKDLSTNPKYFPYRYGHAFWAYVGGTWSDSTAIELYKNTVIYGLKKAIDTTLHLTQDSLSNLWAKALKDHYLALRQEPKDINKGKLLVGKQLGSDINISPSLSPDGRYIAFFSQKEVFTINLYLSDARTGRIIRKLTSIERNEHIDDISYIESAGTWSPDGRKIAYVVFSKGKNKLAIVDVRKNRLQAEIAIPGVPSISNPAWSPSGRQIAVTGLVNGRSDLYLYDLKSKEVRQLTSDFYSDIQPSWSPDGKSIAFASDRLSFKRNTSGPSYLNLSVADISSGTIRNIGVFPGANNLNPVFAGSDSLLFVSNRDGFRNLYLYDLNNKETYQLTDYFTGISGITTFAPAISYSNKTSEVAYSYYEKNGYVIYKARLEEFNWKRISPYDVDFKAAVLPPPLPQKGTETERKIATLNEYDPVEYDSLKEVPYQSKFQLDYIGNTGIGVATSQMGTGLAGGVNTLFSDILGYHTLFAGIALNGRIYDFGGQVAYFNQKNRIGWGASISHIPYRAGRITYLKDSLTFSEDSTLLVDNYALDIYRTFEDQLSLFGYYPLSKTKRFEGGGSFARYSFRVDRINNYYYSGYYLGQNEEKLPSPDGYNLWNVNFAYVGDNSYFGIGAPMKGHRYRFEIKRYGGEFNFYNLLADYRKYIFLNPITLAGRIFHYSRYGIESEDQRLSPLFLGYPTLIRGYNDIRFNSLQSGRSNQISIGDLFGNKILVTNFEVRLPFSGPKQLALINSKYVLTDLNLFVDAGIAWDSPELNTPEESESNRAPGLQNKIVWSTGVSVRVNLFGQLIIEPYYAFPWKREDIKGGTFGLNFTPGW